MLAETAETPFSRARLALRAQVRRLPAARGARGAARRGCCYRRGSDATALFPEIARGAAAPCPSTTSSSTARWWCSTRRRGPSFQRLQQRAQLRRHDRHRARRGRAAGDALRLRPARPSRTSTCAPLPLSQRKRLLQQLLPAGGARCASPTTSTSRARRFYARGRAGSGSRASSPSGPTRPTAPAARRTGSRSAPTAPATSSSSGFTEPAGRADRLRRAAPRRLDEGDGLVYAGRVGTGFSEEQLVDAARAARAGRRERRRLRRRRSPPTAATSGSSRGSSARCATRSWTGDGLLRQPVFLRLRDDKPPEECRPRGAATPATERDREVPPRGEPASGRGGAHGAPRWRRRCPSPTSTRSSGPRRATPRATSSSTTGRSRRGCCRTCRTGRSC